MFVFQFEDGKYLSQSIGKAGTCESKRNYDWWAIRGMDKSFLEDVLERNESCKTEDINKAFLFVSEKSIRNSNCYSWGGTIHEVDVNIVLRK